MIRRLLHALGVPNEPLPGTVLASTPVPERAAPSLAQEALLCSIDPSSGTLWHTADYAVAAALLLELAREGRLDVSGTGKKTRVTVHDARPFGNDELDKTLARLSSGGSDLRLTRYVPILPGAGLIVMRLASQGVLGEETYKRRGVFTTTRLTPAAAAGCDEIVSRIRGALLGDWLPDERTALLISVFEVGIPFRFIVPRGRVRESYRRAQDIREHIGSDERALLSAVLAAQDKDSGDYASSV